MERVPVTFSLAELWLLDDLLLCDFGRDQVDLNEQVALAINACETHHLDSYTLLLNHAQLLAIDMDVRRDARTPEGATGKDILLKSFAARAALSLPWPDAPEPPPPNPSKEGKAGKRRRARDA